MIGSVFKGIGSSLSEGIAETASISSFTSAVGGEKPKDKPKAAKVKAFDEDEAPTKVLQRILTEVQTIHKVIASQIIPPSEEEEIQRDKDKKDDEVIEALEDLRPEEEKEKDKKKKKTPWWKMLWAWISPFIKWITKPLSWIKSLLKVRFIVGLVKFAFTLGRFFLFNPVGIALLAIGIVAINWKAIKKAIKGYINTIKGWVKTALKALHLGWMINEPDEEDDPVGEDVYTGDDSSLPPQLRGPMEDVPPQSSEMMVEDDAMTAEDDAMFEDDPDDVSESTSFTGTVSGLSEEDAAVLASQGVGSTDAATGATIVGPDNPVTVTPKDAGTDIGPIVSQSALEAAAEAETVPQSDQIFRTPNEARAYAEERGLIDYRLEAVTDEWDDPTGEYRIKYAGQMKTGGNIPKDSEALVHAGETVRGQGESKGGTVERAGLALGPATVTRAKPKSMREAMMRLTAPGGGPTIPKGIGGGPKVRREEPESMALTMARLTAPGGGPNVRREEPESMA